MRKIFSGIIVLSLVFMASCRTEDIRTVEIFIPEMKTEADARKIVTLVSGMHGINPRSLVVSRERSSVTVTYNSMKLAIKNIEYGIAEAGYSTYTKLPDSSIREGVPAEAVGTETPADVKPPAVGPLRTPAAPNGPTG